MMRPLALEMLPVVAFLLCLVATSSPSEPCVTQVSVDAFNVTTPFMMFECSRGYCGIDLPCGESSIGSPIPDTISSTSVAMPEVQKILSAMWTWSSKVLAEIDRVVWQVVRETDPTIVTKCRLCLLAMGMYDWEPRWRWPLHTHRSKNDPTVTDVISLVCKGLGLVVVVRFLEVLVCVKMLPHVAVVVLASHTSMIASIANVAAVVMACVGLFLLVIDLHFTLPICATLSLTYWCSAVWIGLTLSLIAGCGLVSIAAAIRWSWLLFPKMQVEVVFPETEESVKFDYDEDTTLEELYRLIPEAFFENPTDFNRYRLMRDGVFAPKGATVDSKGVYTLVAKRGSCFFPPTALVCIVCHFCCLLIGLCG